jgi:hypothetical protein
MERRIPCGALAVMMFFLSIFLGGCMGFPLRGEAETTVFKSADLVGMVYQQGNRPCPGVSVDVLKEGKEESVFRGFTDLNGRFLIPALSSGRHRLRFSKGGYQTLTVSIRFLDPTHIFYTRLASLEDLLLQAEEALDKNLWSQMEAILSEAARIDPHRGELLFLKAVAAARQGRTEEQKMLVDQIKKAGFPTFFLDDREQQP